MARNTSVTIGDHFSGFIAEQAPGGTETLRPRGPAGRRPAAGCAGFAVQGADLQGYVDDGLIVV